MKTKRRNISKKIKLSQPILLFAVVIIPLLIILVNSSAKQEPAPVEIFAINQSTRLVDVSLSSPNNQTIVVSINPNNAKVTATQINLSFDPDALGEPSVTLGDFMFARFGNVKVNNGLLIFTAGTPVEAGGKTSAGTIATIKFANKINSPTTLFLTKDSLVTAIGYNTNVLKNSASITLVPNDSSVTTTNEITTTSTPSPASNSTPTPKPNLLTQVTKLVIKPKSPSPKPSVETTTPSPTPTSSDRTYANLNLQGGGSTPTPTQKPAKQSLLLRFLYWLRDLFASLAS